MGGGGVTTLLTYCRAVRMAMRCLLPRLMDLYGVPLVKPSQQTAT
jgi:hypothetical protein